MSEEETFLLADEVRRQRLSDLYELLKEGTRLSMYINWRVVANLDIKLGMGLRLEGRTYVDLMPRLA